MRNCRIITVSVQHSRPVEASPRETYKIPVQKIDYIFAAWGYLCVQGEWISATVMRQSMIPKLYQQRYSYQIQSRGLRLFFLYRHLESGFLARQFTKVPDFQQKNSCFVKKGFLYKGLPFFLLKWNFFFNIKTGQIPVLRSKTRSRTEGNAFHDLLRQSI